MSLASLRWNSDQTNIKAGRVFSFQKSSKPITTYIIMVALRQKLIPRQSLPELTDPRGSPVSSARRPRNKTRYRDEVAWAVDIDGLKIFQGGSFVTAPKVGLTDVLYQ
jgi:hypothetical protein